MVAPIADSSVVFVNLIGNPKTVSIAFWSDFDFLKKVPFPMITFLFWKNCVGILFLRLFAIPITNPAAILPIEKLWRSILLIMQREDGSHLSPWKWGETFGKFGELNYFNAILSNFS